MQGLPFSRAAKAVSKGAHLAAASRGGRAGGTCPGPSVQAAWRVFGDSGAQLMERCLRCPSCLTATHGKRPEPAHNGPTRSDIHF